MKEMASLEAEETEADNKKMMKKNERLLMIIFPFSPNTVGVAERVLREL